MSELLEMFSLPFKHSKPEKDCPFCPVEKPEDFVSYYKGKDNSSDALGKNMDSPDKLTKSKNFPNIRPKNGKEHRQSKSSKRPKPNPIWSSNDVVAGRVIGDYSCEPHHLIAGNDAMKGSAMELWISAKKGKITKDTGYSINNVENGDWFPSVPENSKVTKANEAKSDFKNWGSLSEEDKQTIAFKVMKANKGQFHKGGHNIDDGKDYHKTYTKEVPKKLKILSTLIHGWANCCFLCDDIDPEKGPFAPNWKVHDMLDRLSGSIDVDLKYLDPKDWDYFISKLAAEFHEPLCSHDQGVVNL